MEKNIGGVVPWLGGKSRSAKNLIKIINGIEHDCFVDLFAGAGNIILRMPSNKVEIYNDINLDLVNLFRVLQNKSKQKRFFKKFEWTICSRDEFNRLEKIDPGTLSHVGRAYRFYYLQKLCFGGKIKSRSYGYSATSKMSLNPATVREDLANVHRRIQKINIENLGYLDCINRYDKNKKVFFFVDPPYYNSTGDYGEGIFRKNDLEILADRLRIIKGNFLLTINDCSEVREIFSGFYCKKVLVPYSIGTKRNKNPELIYSSQGF